MFLQKKPHSHICQQKEFLFSPLNKKPILFSIMAENMDINFVSIVLNIYFVLFWSWMTFFPKWKYLHCQYLLKNGSSLHKEVKISKSPTLTPRN